MEGDREAMLQVILERHGDLISDSEEEDAIVGLHDVNFLSDGSGLTSEASSDGEEDEDDDEDDDDDDDDDNSEDLSSESEAEAEEDETAALIPQNDPGEPIGAGWARYMDPNSGYEYYFNHVSGASQWFRPQLSRSAAVQPIPSGASVTPKRRRGRSTPSKSDIEWNQNLDDSDASSNSEDDGQSDDEDIEADEDSDLIRGKDDVVRAVNFYVWSSIFHIVCIEGPAVALEAFFRGLYLVFMGLVLTLAQQPYELGRGRLNQGLHMLVALPLLLVPGSLLLAYKDLLFAWRDGRLARSAHVDDWRLGALPTLAGPLKADAFHVVQLGQGAHARK